MRVVYDGILDKMADEHQKACEEGRRIKAFVLTPSELEEFDRMMVDLAGTSDTAAILYAQVPKRRWYWGARVLGEGEAL